MPTLPDPFSPQGFGHWLRGLREAKGELQRGLASAADMDSSHLGKIERGERLPTDAQALAFARFLDVAEADMRARLVAAKVMQVCGGDAVLAHSAASLVQEAAAPHLVNNPANKPVKKLRTKR